MGEEEILGTLTELAGNEYYWDVWRDDDLLELVQLAKKIAVTGRAMLVERLTAENKRINGLLEQALREPVEGGQG